MEKTVPLHAVNVSTQHCVTRKMELVLTDARRNGLDLCVTVCINL